jgi:prepilin-type N-terminal cleavage/methylation domain-containing protein
MTNGDWKTSGKMWERPFVIRHSSLTRRGFTLIEIMVVVAIIALIVGAGLPTLYGVFHKEGLRKTTSDIMDTCLSARAQAIIGGSTTELVFHPGEGTCEATGSANHGNWVHSAKLDNCYIEMLAVNMEECKDRDTVKVRFFPNGTCDEMMLVLQTKDGEWRKITLEVTTALPTLTSKVR